MLGSISDADDAVQNTWLRLSRSDAAAIQDLEGWLIRVVARVCLDELRARSSRHAGPPAWRVPDPLVSRDDQMDPEQIALLGDSVGLALLVVLDTLTPAERLVFVLHDVFAVPFDRIAPIVDRTAAATRKLASRARNRVRGAPLPDMDLRAQRELVDAFFAAVRAGDLERLLTLLDPEVVVRADLGALHAGSRQVRGARAVAEESLAFARYTMFGRPALVNGAVGVVAAAPGRPYSVIGFTVRGGKIAEIDILADLERLRRLDLAGLDSQPHALPDRR